MRIPVRLGYFLAVPPVLRLSSCAGSYPGSSKMRVPSCRSLSSTTKNDDAEMLMESRQSFLDWANAHTVPLNDDDDPGEEFWTALTETIGDVSVVALSEGFHNCKEMMALHHRIIQYLVEHHGFTTVITESGLPESRKIHDYIRGNAGNGNSDDDKELLYKQGLNKMYSEWGEGRALIEWMRHYNQEHNNCLTYYGSDIGGFYQDWKTPIQDGVLNYLSTVDPDFHDQLATDLQPYMDLMSQNARLNYQEQLSRLEKARLEVILEDALERMDSNRATYIAKVGKNDDLTDEIEYEWARQSLESMRLAEQYYRNYEQQCHPETSKCVGLNGREIAMHRNTLWALEQERKRLGRNAKAIVISHVIHTKTESQYQDELWGYFTPAGQMLKQSLGGNNRFCAIGMVYGGGEYWQGWQKGRNARKVAAIPSPKENGLEALLGELTSEEDYFLPWKSAPQSAQPWLSSLCSLRENDYFINIRPREWDGCIFLNNVHPATPVK